MLPDTAEAEQVRLYTAPLLDGPWTLASVLLKDIALRNPSIMLHEGEWYIFGGDAYDINATLVYHSPGMQPCNLAELYACQQAFLALLGPWHAHPINLVPAREKEFTMLAGWPAGRLCQLGSKLFRFVQVRIFFFCTHCGLS